MEIEKVTATKCYVKNVTSDEIESLKKDLTFTDTSVAFNIKNLKQNRWLKQNRPHTYNQRLAELERQLKTCLLKSDSYGHWFNPGTIPYLKDYNFKVLNKITYPEPRKIPWRKPLPFDLYPYQSESVKRLMEVKHGCVSLATGMGKTAIILKLARELGLRTIIVTPSKSIFLEILSKFEFHFGKSNVGAYGNGKKRLGKLFTVCVSKSLTMLKPGTKDYDFFKSADVVIGDECFPYDTKIQTKDGNIRIGTIVNDFLKNKKIPKVLSFNETTKKFEYKKVLNAWKRDLKDIIKISCGNSSFRCTNDHKVLTENKGWVEAKYLEKGDLIISTPNNKKACFSFRIPNNELEDLIIGSFLGDGSVSYSKNNMPRLRINHGIKQKKYALWKLGLMKEIKGSSWIVEKNGYAQKPAIQTTSKCFYYKNIFPENKKVCPKWVMEKINFRTIAIWFMDDGSIRCRNGKAAAATIHTESFDDESVNMLVNKLNSMGIDCKKMKSKNRNIIRMGIKGTNSLLKKIAPYFHRSMDYKLAQYSSINKKNWNTKCLDYSYSVVTKKEKTSNVFSKKYKQFLFDIEVEGNHNFVVGNQGFVAHNCHTLAANTLEKVFHGVLEKVPYRFFLSGTITRGDGKEILLRSIVGKEVLNKNTKYAIDGGYICPVEFTVIETTSKNVKKYSNPLEAKRKQFLRNENIANITAKIANSAWNVKQESTLILVDELEQIQMLADRLEVPYGYAHSADKKKANSFGLDKVKPEEMVEAFNKGEIKVLIGTSCIATGTNLYSTHNVVNWVGGSSEVRTKQGAVGRSVRLLEKSQYKDFHKPKPFSKIYDFKVSNVPLMENHLQKRLAMYRETNKDIKFVKVT